MGGGLGVAGGVDLTCTWWLGEPMARCPGLVGDAPLGLDAGA